MALLHYLQPTRGLPDPRGPLNSQVSATTIAAANKEVEKAMKSDRTPRGKCGPYKRYSPSLRAEIAKYECMHGAGATARRYSNKLNECVSKSTVMTVKKQYEDELRKRQTTDDGEDLLVLPTKKLGRKVLLGEKLDSMVLYLRKVREGGGAVSVKIVVAAARRYSGHI